MWFTPYPLCWFFSLQHIRDCVKMYSHKRNIVPIPSVKTHCHKRHKEHKRIQLAYRERNEPQKIILMSCPHALSGHLSPHDTGIFWEMKSGESLFVRRLTNRRLPTTPVPICSQAHKQETPHDTGPYLFASSQTGDSTSIKN